MNSLFKLCLSSFFTVFLPLGTLYADHHMSKFGTREEARDLLDRAINLMKHDKNYALMMMSIGRGGLYEKDLYPFCANKDGVLTGHPFNVGLNIMGFKDVDGVKVGDLIFKNATEGKVSEVKYKLARLEEGVLSKKIYTKISFVTKIDDHVCAVGYYKK